MSALPSKADMCGAQVHVRFVPLDARFKEWGCRVPRKLLFLHDLSPTPSKHLTQCLPAFRHPRAQVKLCVGPQSLPKAGRACGIRARGGAGQVSYLHPIRSGTAETATAPMKSRRCSRPSRSRRATPIFKADWTEELLL